MKVKVLAATVAIVSLSWLGISFSTPADPTEIQFSVVGEAVSAEHPDSHRLGEMITEEVALPEWKSTDGEMELALIVAE